MKFGVQFLLLFFFVSLLPTFLNAEPKDCAVYGRCYLNGQKRDTNFYGLQNKSCTDGICYAFECVTVDGMVMWGGGCYDDFVNTCKHIQSNITEKAKAMAKLHKTFTYHDENVLVASCGASWGIPFCAQDNLDIHVNYGTHGFARKELGRNHTKHDQPGDEFKKCEYKNDTVPELPKIQCFKGGECFVDKQLYYSSSKNSPTVSCDACVRFECTENNVTKYGSGCLEDFERICTNVSSNVTQQMKENETNYYYMDENTLMVSCSSGDNCQNDAMKFFQKSVPQYYDIVKKLNINPSNQTCTYDPSELTSETINPEQKNQTDDPETTNRTDNPETNKNGANGFGHSGLIIFGFIHFNLL